MQIHFLSKIIIGMPFITDCVRYYFELNSSPLNTKASSATDNSQITWFSPDAEATTSLFNKSIRFSDTSSVCGTITRHDTGRQYIQRHYYYWRSFSCILSSSDPSVTSAQWVSHSLLYPRVVSSSNSQSERSSGSLNARDWTEWVDDDLEWPRGDWLSTSCDNSSASSFSTLTTSSVYAARAFSVRSRSLKKYS